jgi:transposase
MYGRSIQGESRSCGWNLSDEMPLAQGGMRSAWWQVPGGIYKVPHSWTGLLEQFHKLCSSATKHFCGTVGAMTPIPVPVRQRIVQLYDRGKSTREIAQYCGFCVAAVRRVRQQFQQRGTLEPRTRRSGRRTDRRFRTSTIDLWLRKLGWRYKKNAGRRRTRTARRSHKKSAVA